MSTSTSNSTSTSTSLSLTSQTSRKSSTTSRHRRSTISLHSRPSLNLIRTISRDLVTGWHTSTPLQKESSSSSCSSSTLQKPYKPRYAARDALKGFPSHRNQDSTNSNNNNNNINNANQSFESEREMDIRSRQDSVTMKAEMMVAVMGGKQQQQRQQQQQQKQNPSGCVEKGLIVNHSFDTWTEAWDIAYEKRAAVYHTPGPATSASKPSNRPPPATSETKSKPSSATFASRTSLAKHPSAEFRVARKRTVQPLFSSPFSPADAEIKSFVCGTRHEEQRSCDSPEGGLVQRAGRKGSIGPKLMIPDVEELGRGLENLEEEGEGEGEEEDERQGQGQGQGKAKDECEGKGKMGRGEKEKSGRKRFGKVFVAPLIPDVKDKMLVM